MNGVEPSKDGGFTYWDTLRISEQAQLFDYGLHLIDEGTIPADIPEGELMAKLERMHQCDTNQINYLNEFDLEF